MVLQKNNLVARKNQESLLLDNQTARLGRFCRNQTFSLVYKMCLFLFLMVYLDNVQLSQSLLICRKQTSPFAFNLLNLAHLVEININSKEICHGTSNFHLQHLKSHCQSNQYIHACMYLIILTFSPATILRPTLLFPFFCNL